MRYLEDLRPGEVFDLGEDTIREDEILEFARRFDAQPFHVDREAARQSMYGGLIASGWHTASFFMGLLVRGLLLDVALRQAGTSTQRIDLASNLIVRTSFLQLRDPSRLSGKKTIVDDIQPVLCLFLLCHYPAPS